MTLEETYPKEKIASFGKFRDDLAQSILRQQQAYDQTVLKLAAAGLGLTVTLATALIAAEQPVRHHAPLVLAWLFLSGSLASVIASFLTSQSESRKRIALIDKEKFKEAANPELTNLTRRINYCSGGLLVVGSFSLSLFITLNV